MGLGKANKEKIIKKFQRSANDTGSSEVQIALLSNRITHLTEHLKKNKNDVHTRHGLSKLVSQRRRLMKYLKVKDIKKYQNVIKECDIRG